MVHTSYAQWACLPSTYRKKVNPGSKAAQQGVREGDLISSINDKTTRDLTNGESHALLRNAGHNLKLGLNQDTGSSPKRRIYKSSLQENTSIETLKKTTTKTTTTSSTQILSSEANKRNGIDDTRTEREILVSQNGGLKTSPVGTERGTTDGETKRSKNRPIDRTSGYVTEDCEDHRYGLRMPRGSRNRQKRRTRNTKRSSNNQQRPGDRQRQSASTTDNNEPREDPSELESVTNDEDSILDRDTRGEFTDNDVHPMKKCEKAQNDLDKREFIDEKSNVFEDAPIVEDGVNILDERADESSAEGLTEAKVNGHPVRVTTEESTSRTAEDGVGIRDVVEFHGHRGRGSISVNRGSSSAAAAAAAAARRRLRVERRAMNTETKIFEITSVSGLPLAASIGHVAGVGIIETGMTTSDEVGGTIVTVSEPVEPVEPLSSGVASKVETLLGERDLSMAILARGTDDKRDGPEIHEVSDSDAETDNSSNRPTTAAAFVVEAESDVERESVLDRSCRESIAEEVDEEEELVESEDRGALDEIDIPEIGGPVDREVLGNEIQKTIEEIEESEDIGSKSEDGSSAIPNERSCSPVEVATFLVDKVDGEEDDDEEDSGERSSSVEEDSLEEKLDRVARAGESEAKNVKTASREEEEKCVITGDGNASPSVARVKGLDSREETEVDKSVRDMEVPKEDSSSGASEESRISNSPTVRVIPVEVEKSVKPPVASVREEVENKLRLFIESMEYPSLHDEGQAVDQRGFEIERETSESSSQRRAKKRAIIDSYYAEAKNADRFLDIIQEEVDNKFLDGGEQHIRDFINGEIGKFRREEREAAGRAESCKKDFFSSEDVTDESSKLTTVPEEDGRSVRKQQISASSVETLINTEETKVQSTKETRIEVTKKSTCEEKKISATSESERAIKSSNLTTNSEATNSTNVTSNGTARGKKMSDNEMAPPEPPTRFSSFVPEKEPLRPPTPPDVDYPVELPEVPARPDEALLSLQRSPVPPPRGRNSHSSNDENYNECPRRPPLPDDLFAMNDRMLTERIYENVDYTGVGVADSRPNEVPPPLPPLPRDFQASENGNALAEVSFELSDSQDGSRHVCRRNDVEGFVNDNSPMSSSTSREHRRDDHRLRNIGAVDEANIGRYAAGNDASLEIESSAGNADDDMNAAMMLLRAPEQQQQQQQQQRHRKITTPDFGHSSLACRRPKVSRQQSREPCSPEADLVETNKQKTADRDNKVKVENSTSGRREDLVKFEPLSDATLRDRRVENSGEVENENFPDKHGEKNLNKVRIVPIEKSWQSPNVKNKKFFELVENSESTEFHRETGDDFYEKISSVGKSRRDASLRPSGGSSAANPAREAANNSIDESRTLSDTTSGSRDTVENNQAEKPTRPPRRQQQQQHSSSSAASSSSSSSRLLGAPSVEPCTSHGQTNSGTVVANKNSGDDRPSDLPTVILTRTSEKEFDSNRRPSSPDRAEDADDQESSSSGAASPNTVRFNPSASSFTDLASLEIREDLEKADTTRRTESSRLKIANFSTSDDGREITDKSAESPEEEDLYYVPVQERNHPTSGDEPNKIEDARPDLLKDLCMRKILSLPYGLQIINEITLPKFNIFKNLQTIQECASCVEENRTDYTDRRYGGANVDGDRDPSSFEEMKKHRPRTWMGVPTIEDPRLLVCLSPSQQDSAVRTSADNLLDLHKKYLNRRSYHEDRWEEVSVPHYRVDLGPEVNGSLSEALQGDERRFKDRRVSGPANRLLEIIKENPINSSNRSSSDHRSKSTNSINGDSDRKGDGNKYEDSRDFGEDRLKATRLSDWLSLARRDELDYSLRPRPNETPDRFVKTRGVSGSEGSSAANRGSSARTVLEASASGNGDTRDGDVNNERSIGEEERSQGRRHCRNDVGATKKTSNSRYEKLYEKVINEMENSAQLIGKRFRESAGHRVNSALIVKSTPGSAEEQQQAAATRSSTPAHHFDKSPISLNSAIIDRSSTLESGNNDPSRKRTPGNIDPWHGVNPALIDDRDDNEDTGTSSAKLRRPIVVDRSCIDTTSIFDKTPPRCHLERRKYQDPEALKQVTATEIVENLKRLQTSAKQQRDSRQNVIVDGRRRYSLPQEYFERQLNYIEQLENQLKEVILAEEEERRAYEEFRGHVNGESPDRVRSMTDLEDHRESGKIARTENLKKDRDGSRDISEGESGSQRESWREESRTAEGDSSEFSLKEGHREATKSVADEGDLRVENSSTSYESVEEKRIESAGKKIDDGSSELGAQWKRFFEDDKLAEYFPASGTQESRESFVKKSSSNVKIERPLSSAKSGKSSSSCATLPTNGEVFRRKMYDEYVHKVLEREERKQHKVIKISSHADLDKTSNGTAGAKSPVDSGMTKMEREFIERARNRMSRFGIDLDESGVSEAAGDDKDEQRVKNEESPINSSIRSKVKINVDESGNDTAKCLIDGREIKDARNLPKHLQEFLELATSTREIEDARGKTNATDLLHEIDTALKIGKGFLLGEESVMFAPTFKASSAKPGVWSPGSEPPPPPKQPSPERGKNTDKDAGIPPVWTPSSAGASPVAERKEFRPVAFESPVLSRKKLPSQIPSSETPPPWKEEDNTTDASQTVTHNITTRIVNSHSAPSQGLNTLAGAPRLPRAQNPTITLLQKAREGQLPKGAAYLEDIEPSVPRVRSHEGPRIDPGEIIYAVKREYESEPETVTEKPKKMADLGPRKIEGIGPITKDGMPVALRSEVKDNNQARWYKKMYDSLHRADKDDDYITVRYKPRRGTRHGYGSASGYLSEPEPRGYSERSVTLDTRRRQRNKENDFSTSTMPRKAPPLKHPEEVYRNQPGRIEDYVPGRSSIADKETKEWWDEVMDIFDGPFDQRNPHTAKPYMSQALKESGYESDSTLIFRRRDDARPLSPLEQRLAYKTVQKGGDVPLHGFRKPAPERPKDDAEIEYFPISPTLTRIRVRRRSTAVTTAEATSMSSSSASMTFARYKRTAPSATTTTILPLGRVATIRNGARSIVARTSSTTTTTTTTARRTNSPPPGRPPTRATSPSARPPSPPRRRSSRNNATLRRFANGKTALRSSSCPGRNRVCTSNRRHEQCFAAESASNIRFLRERLSSKLHEQVRDRESSRKSLGIIRTCPSSGSSGSRTKLAVARSVQSELPKRKSEPCLVKTLRESSVSPGRGSLVSSPKSTATPSRVSKSSSPVSRSSTELRNQKRTCELKLSSEEKPATGGSSSKSPSFAGPRSSGINGSAVPERTPRQNVRSRIPSTCSLKKDQAKARKTRKESSESSKRLSASSVDLAAPVEVKRELLKQREINRAPRSPTSGTAVIQRTSTSGNTKQKTAEAKLTKSTAPIVTKIRTSPKASPKDTSTTSRSSLTSPTTPGRRATPCDAWRQSSTPGRVKDKKYSFGEVHTSPNSSPVALATDLANRKRPREKAETIVKHPTKRPERIEANPQERRNEAKRRGSTNREKSREPPRPKRASNDRDSDSEGRRSKKSSSTKGASCGERRTKKIAIKEVEAPTLTMEQIKKHQEATRTDTFFQNLFLRNTPSPAPSQASTLRRSSVMERARMFQDFSTDHFKSEPSLRSLGVYLAQKRPVSNSRFKNFERDSLSSRSSSPYGVSWPGRSVFQKISKFDSLVGMDEFGSSASLRGRSPSPMTREYSKERSLSEPPLKSVCSRDGPEVVRAASPSTRTASPSPTRSAACRRIRSLRQQDRHEILPIKTRTRSASEAEDSDRRRAANFGSNLSLAKSTGSLESPPATRDDYQRYLLETLRRRRKSERYRDLHDFYASLERMGELERTATSSGDLRPRLRDEEIIDYDRWRVIRSRERAEEELKALYGKLKDVQRDKDFLFSTRDLEKYRWRGDCGLRCKERSVENIRESFRRLENEESELESTRRREIASKKDVYKPLWRGNSVANVASNIAKRAASMDEESERSSVQPALQRRLGGSKKFWSSLSTEQVTTLKNQLNEIYGTDINGKPRTTGGAVKSEADKSASIAREDIEIGKQREATRKPASARSVYEVVVPPEEEFGESVEEQPKGLHVRCHSMLTPAVIGSQIEEPSGETVVCGPSPIFKRRGSIGNGRSLEASKIAKPAPAPPPLSEMEKKRLSLTLGKEILDKVTRRTSAMHVAPRETRGAIAAASAKPKSSSSSGVASVTNTSPRTCYSLENSLDEDNSTSRSREKSDFLLVLTPNDDSPTNKRRVENVLDEWSRKPPLLAVSVSTENSCKPNATTSGSEFDSATESSETSVRTVVRRGSEAEAVPRKVEFFESIERTGKSTEERAIRGEKSLAGTEVKRDDRTTERRLGKLSSAQSFADLKELFGEIESARYSTSLPFRGNGRARSTSPGSDQPMDGSGRGGRSASASPDVPNGRLQKWRPSSRPQSGDRARARSVSPCPVSDSTCSLESSRNRSVSPDPERYWRAYLNLVNNGSVRKLRAKFESLEELTGGRTRLVPTPKRFRSDPELTRNLLNRANDERRTYLKAQEVSDVAWLRRRYEPTTRGRARRRGARSPPIPRIPLRLEDLSMPRINVISKTAELKDDLVRSGSTDSLARKAETEELEAKRPVGRIREKFERFDGKSTRDGKPSLLGEMFTSAPNVHELRDIAPYLAGRWVAHKYPSRRDNARSLSLPPDLENSGVEASTNNEEVVRPRLGRTNGRAKSGERAKKSREKRAVSSSPVRPRTPTSILKQSHADPFADQAFDPSKHRPRYRYQPPPPPPLPPAPIVRRETRAWWPPIPTYTAKPTVTFEGPLSLG